MKVRDKVVVVTGAGSGMGRELSLELLSRGASVAGVDLREAGLEETERRAGARDARWARFPLDITDRAAVAALPERVKTRFGQVDGVINCAGIIQPFVRLVSLDDAAIERVMQVNFYGTLQMMRAFLPHLLARPSAHVVNVSSMGGFLPVPGQTLYGASKAAVKLLTEGLHAELAGTPVRVTIVFPGAIATDITKNSGVTIPGVDPEKSRLKPYPADRAARDILDAMERDRYRVLVGPDAKLLDALYRLHPRRAAAFIAAQMKELLPS
jgi:NAD(P)-dependent dehydrogenase (short-subunit alcohol dehydrogenase family)